MSTNSGMIIQAEDVEGGGRCLLYNRPSENIHAKPTPDKLKCLPDTLQNPKISVQQYW
jgi:hypothetical protein